jgi:hypothetical protein
MDITNWLTQEVRTWEFFIPPQQQQSLSPIQAPFTGSLHAAHPSPHTHRPAPSPLLQAFDLDPRRILRRRSSLVVDDLSADFKRHSLHDDDGILEESETNGVNGTSKKEEPKAKPPLAEKKKPTQFDEPDANSLLDAFGF